MEIARTAASGADCQLARHMRVGACRKSGYLLVTNVNPLNRSFTTDRIDDPV
jgi:hypothetical protein